MNCRPVTGTLTLSLSSPTKFDMLGLRYGCWMPLSRRNDIYWCAHARSVAERE